ncbi:unnamed protein product [Rotaria sordida]|uniref:Ig-like domain-containing protein n=1 Tax=Rotaria sordida TaxID=392033 RepID=A0A818LBV6_9BILA|nr:unnamed protein product [Rotaria sordida]
MYFHQRLFVIWLLFLTIDIIYADRRTQAKRVTAERGSDLSLSCTFQDEDSDKTIVQWLYQNVTDSNINHRTHKIHWRPLFLNAQSLTPSETRYSIQQKIQQINDTSIAYITILTLSKVNESDEGLYICKSLSPKTIQMAYQVRVIQSLDINPTEVLISTDEIGQYSIRLNCILTDSHLEERHHDIHWWHNNKRINTNSNRHTRITKNFTRHSFISTLFYTDEPANIAGIYMCEADPIRKYIPVELKSNQSSDEQNFLHDCLALKTLCAIPNRDSERDEFIQFCQENDFLQYISEFEFPHRPDVAIQLYTRSSGFSSKIINSTCRTQDLLLISKIRYCLKHLHEQLTRLYIDSLFWIPKFITVYRGQRFSMEEFQKLVQCHEKTILTTQYLSTTSVYDIAVAFAGYDIHSNESLKDEVAVIFKISIRTKNSHLKPFAYIQEYSHIIDEKEMLISMGTVFSIVDICQRGENFYEILLRHDQAEKEIEQKILNKAIETFSNGTTITIGDFLISANIHSPLDDDFYRQPLTSLLEEYSQCQSGNIIDSVSDQILLLFTTEKVQEYQNTIKIKQLSTESFKHSSTESSIMSIPICSLGVTHDHLIIWLDQFIGENNVYVDLKETLADAVDLNIDAPFTGDEIDTLIFNDKIYHPKKVLIAVKTIEEYLDLIHTNQNKRIFLITSGSLGEQVVPGLLYTYPCLEKIFIFCGSILKHMNWALDFEDNLLMFDFPNDVLGRVVYDIGAWHSPTAIEGQIAREENLLPRDLLQHMLNNI